MIYSLSEKKLTESVAVGVEYVYIVNLKGKVSADPDRSPSSAQTFHCGSFTKECAKSISRKQLHGNKDIVLGLKKTPSVEARLSFCFVARSANNCKLLGNMLCNGHDIFRSIRERNTKVTSFTGQKCVVSNESYS